MASQIKNLVDNLIDSKKVVVFSKSYCPNSVRVKNVLKGYNLSAEDLEVIELDTPPYDDEMEAIQEYLKKLTGARSTPRVFIDGKPLGGCEEIEAAHKSGNLHAMVAEYY